MIRNKILWNGNFYGESYDFSYNTIRPKELPFNFQEFETEENNLQIILKEKNVSFNVEKKDFYEEGIFTVIKEDTIAYFDKTEKNLVFVKENRIRELCDSNYDANNNCNEDPLSFEYNKNVMFEFIWKMYKELNVTVAQAIFNRHNFYHYGNAIHFFFKYANEEDSLAIEKMLASTGVDTTFNCIMTDGFELSSGRKLKQILEIPALIINWLKEKGMNNLIPQFKIICSEDPNEGVFLIEYLEKITKLKQFKKFSIEEYLVGDFIRNIAKIKSLSSIKIFNLIPYLIKQKVYYNSYFIRESNRYYPASRNPIREIFLPPNEELRTYIDYIKMGGTDPMPYILTIAHDAILRNQKFSNNTELSAKIQALSPIFEEYSFEDDNFIITYPKDVNDLITEGNELCHCVATYSVPISLGHTKVFFLRKKDNKDVPYVTIEIDNSNNIIQVKGKYNLDVTDKDTLDFIKKWQKKKL